MRFRDARRTAPGDLLIPTLLCYHVQSRSRDSLFLCVLCVLRGEEFSSLRVLVVSVSNAVHVRNNLECRYCCDIIAMSSAGANDSGAALRCAIASTMSGTRSSACASRPCASV